MNEALIRNFEMYFPSIALEAEEISIEHGYEVIARLSDGRCMLYDDTDKTIRNLPRDYKRMSELECRDEFGRRLRRMMWRRGMTQEDISQATGIDRSMISSYITGRNTPSFYKVDLIAKALNCSVDEFRYTGIHND